jgi:hypothetical protein
VTTMSVVTGKATAPGLGLKEGDRVLFYFSLFHAR